MRVATEVNSGTAQAGQRFQGNLDADLVADGRVVATRGARVYGRVVAAKAGTGTGGAPAPIRALSPGSLYPEGDAPSVLVPDSPRASEALFQPRISPAWSMAFS